MKTQVLSDTFLALTGNSPFPWQCALLTRFASGNIDRSLDIPTGLGKTAVMAIWLVARAERAMLPRRLVYVVDRRAVVDQATEVAQRLRVTVDGNAELKQALGLGERPLPISTLRGQHVDNREWLEDPALPAIVVGTVDMIGSRLLFEGYGTSRKMRPYHAGLLGADTLVVLDEAHLVPSFEMLIETIAEGARSFGPDDESLQRIVPPFKLLSLSATGRTRGADSFRLTDADLKDDKVKRRLNARKRLTIKPLKENKKLPEVLAEEAWKLTHNGKAAVRVIIFCNRRKDAEDTNDEIRKLALGDKKQGNPEVTIDRALFVGGRRVFERDKSAKWLSDHGFLAGTEKKPERPAFLFATSAGEVGVDLDADHMVCDLVAWERMVQRLGRVNRRGDGDATVIVIDAPQVRPEKALGKDANKRTETEANAVAGYVEWIAHSKAVRLLPVQDGSFDASPGAIRDLKLHAEPAPASNMDADSHVRAWRRWILQTASTPGPLRPALSRALVEAWSMTSLQEHTGRPKVEPWLRGWVDDEPQTSVIWRTHFPVRPHQDLTTKKATKAYFQEIQDFFEAAPPHLSEVLETETYGVVDWLTVRAKAIERAIRASKSQVHFVERPQETRDLSMRDIVAVVLSPAREVREIYSLEQFLFQSDDKKANKQAKDELYNFLANATLIVDVRIAGLDDGLLNNKADIPARTADDGEIWLEPMDNQPVIRFRARKKDVNDSPPSGDEQSWKERFRFPTEVSEEGEAICWLTVYKWRHDGATEDDRSAGRLQLLAEHQESAEGKARELGSRLDLPQQYIDMLAIAARLHDEGKRAKRWQRAFNAPRSGIYAKTPGPIEFALLDGYRHEFGSLPIAVQDSEFRELPEELQDLALHLIAAHHGFARPAISTRGCEDAPPSLLEQRALEVAMRFARLQKRWGPWGVAWWESLLRAADQQASRENEEND